MTNYAKDFNNQMTSNFHIPSQSEMESQPCVSSSLDKFKRKSKDINFNNDVSFHNSDTFYYSNESRDYSKMRKSGNNKMSPYFHGESYPSRRVPTLWQSTSHDKSHVSLNTNQIDDLSNSPENGLNSNSSSRTVSNSINEADSLIDTRSPMLSDFTHQNSSLLIENCLVSSSTGHIESIPIPSIPNIVGENSHFLYNPNLLDSNVDSTTSRIIHSCSGAESEDDFQSECVSVESSTKFCVDGQNFPSEKYFIFDHIQNEVIRLNHGETCNSDRNSLIGVPGSSGVSKYNRTNQKFVKICEKSPQDKNVLYCLQNFPFDVESAGHTSTDFIPLRDSVSSTEFHSEISEGDRKCTALNLNKLSNEFYSNKKFSGNHESNIFEEEPFPVSEFPINSEGIKENEPFVSNQHFIRDDFSIRPNESIINKAYTRLNQQESPYLSPLQCFNVENMDINSARDMTTRKRIKITDSNAASVFNICELNSSQDDDTSTESNYSPEDLSSPTKYQNKDYRETIEDIFSDPKFGKAICKNSSPGVTKIISHMETSSYGPFDATISNIDTEMKFRNGRQKPLERSDKSELNVSSNKSTFEDVSIDKQNISEQRKGYHFRSPASHEASLLQGQVEPENLNTSGFWCDECNKYLGDLCSIHPIRTINDKPVHTRPWTSIPTEYLCIKVINNDNGINGVFTRKNIARRSKFGPVEGTFVEGEPSYSEKVFFVTKNSVRGYLDTSDDYRSNWMKFVRWAESFTEVNCVAVEEDNYVYFLTTVDISTKKELKIGYSKQYSMKYGLQYLTPSDEELAALEPKEKSWSCFECDEKFKSSNLLEEHLSLHDKDEPKKKRKKRKAKFKLNCSYKKSKKEINVELDGNNYLKESLQKCEVCGLLFKNIDLLLLHKELHISEKSNRIECAEKQMDNICPTCNQIYKTRNDLSHHVNSHSIKKNDKLVKKLYKCKLCYKGFESEAKLVSHAVVHVVKPNGDYPCNMCHRRFSNLQTLTSHQKFHKDNSSEYICPMCNKKFDSLSLMKLHIPEHHINGVYTCPYCQKAFPIYPKIRRHIRTYHPETFHPCPKCGKPTSSVDKLKLHMLIHSDRRDFICDVCQKGFKRKDKLKEHQKRGHANIRGRISTNPEVKVANKNIESFKYKCQQCIRGFKRRGMLVNHLSKRHPNISLDSVPELNQPILKECRIFFCHYCNKSYETSSKRKVHILKHHPGAELIPGNAEGSGGKICNTIVLTPKKAFAVSCPYCPRQYATNAKLLQHQRKHHKTEKSKKSNAKMVAIEQKSSEVLVTTSLQDDQLDNSQLIRLTPLNPLVQVQLKDDTRFVDGEEVYVNVPPTQPVMIEGDFNDEQTLTVLTSNSDDTFCVALRPGQLLSNIGVICQSDLPYVATSTKNGQFVGEDTFQEEHINFTTDAAKGECILTQVDSNSPVLLWQPSLFSSVN